jgi:hypothetical protein
MCVLLITASTCVWIGNWMSQTEVQTAIITTAQIHSNNNTSTTSQPQIRIYIHTASHEINDRNRLRQSWMTDARQRGVSVYFIAGLSHNNTINEHVINEQSSTSDLLVFNFIQSHRMSSVSVFYNLRWHVEHADEAIVVLTDMNNYLNVTNLLEYIDVNSIAKQNGVIHGCCTCTGACRGLGVQSVDRDNGLELTYGLVSIDLFMQLSKLCASGNIPGTVLPTLLCTFDNNLFTWLY